MDIAASSSGFKLFKYFLLLSFALTTACSTFERSTPTVKTRQFPIDNCAVGCPVGGSEVTLVREAYTLNNDATSKFAKWVAYRVTKDTPASNRPRNWKKDPDIPDGDTLDPPDYTGANASLHVDRGHQANLASMGGVPDWEALNYLSNITPQKAELNQGPWARLEDQERNLVTHPDIHEVYVATGPLYERYIGTLPGTTKQHTIPSGYWKIIFTNETPTLTTFSAFIMDQETPRSASFCTYQVTVDQIEWRTGLRFWSKLPIEDQPPLSRRLAGWPARLAVDNRRASAQETIMTFDWHAGLITRDTALDKNYRNTQKVRRFLVSQCGEGFKFNRPFMAWIKDSEALTMGDVVDEWNRLNR